MDPHMMEAVEGLVDAPAVLDVHVEVCLRPGSTAPAAGIKDAVLRLIQEKGCIMYQDGPLDVTSLTDSCAMSSQGGQDNLAALLTHVESVAVVDADPALYSLGGLLMSWQYSPIIHVYSVSDEEPAEDDEGEDGVPSFKEWVLPGAPFKGLWSCLYYDSSIKSRLLRYATSALLFSERGVSTDLVSWNRVVLLHGPPGTGKTSLCKALAHKLAVRFSHRYRSASLIEVNAHSLFSKFFSESGKQVQKLFTKITELTEDTDVLVFVLIDEIESLAAARKTAAGGSEPGDAVRAVNALLTQIDALKRFPNSMVLSTSNLSAAIDVAFVDRADIKAYIGPPSLAARYEIIRTSLQELAKRGILTGEAGAMLWPHAKLAPYISSIHPAGSTQGILLPGGGGARVVLAQDPEPGEAPALVLSAVLLSTAAACEGLSGRALRKLPFLAHALHEGTLHLPCGVGQYLAAMRMAAAKEKEDRADIESNGT